MNKYELLFIISSDTADEGKEATLEKVKGFITSNGGTIEGVDKWGVRKFAYEIKFRNEGYYVLINLTATPNAIATINRNMNLTENIVRQMFVKKSA